MTNTQKYKVTIISFAGEGETLTAQALYEQTVETLDIRAVIEAVNLQDPIVNLLPAPKKRQRALRSDAGKPRRAPDAIPSVVV